MSRAWEGRKNGIIGLWNTHWQKPEVSSSLRCCLSLIQSSDSLCLTKYLTSDLGLNYDWQSFQAPQVPLTSCSSVEASQGNEYSLWGKCWIPSQASRVGLWVPLGVQGFWKLHMLTVRRYRADVCVRCWDVPQRSFGSTACHSNSYQKKAAKITESTGQLKAWLRQKTNNMEPHMKPHSQSSPVSSVLMGHPWKHSLQARTQSWYSLSLAYPQQGT